MDGGADLSATGGEACEGRAQARVGLLGNPSDGFGGRVLAFTFAERGTKAWARPDDEVALCPGTVHELRASDLGELREHVRSCRARGGARLLAAAALRLPPEAVRGGFALAFETDVPRQAGLGGSSAIVVAALRALSRLFALELAPLELARLALEAETQELGIAAGPQDRVVQALGGLLFMDFAAPEPRVERLEPALLPPLFVAWDPAPGASSGEAHGDLRARHARGEPAVLRALDTFPRLADAGRARLLAGEADALRELLDASHDARASIWPLSEADRELVAIARARGAAASLAGSGGAVVGVPRSAEELDALERAYRDAGYALLRPTVPSGPVPS